METIYTGKIFTIVKKFITNKNGEQLERHVVVHPGAVVVLPLLPDNRIVLIRQHRIAVEENLIELPAGTREADEEPIITARRELQEETSYRANELVPVMSFYTSPGFVKEEMHLFKATELSAGPTAFDEDEKIEPLVMDFSAAMKMLHAGEIRDAKTIIGLLWYQQHLKEEC